MSRDRLIERLARGDVILLRPPHGQARVIDLLPAGPEHPEGAIEVRFRYVDGMCAGSWDSVVARPLDRVRLP